jgi:hypothetical protein
MVVEVVVLPVELVLVLQQLLELAVLVTHLVAMVVTVV